MPLPLDVPDRLLPTRASENITVFEVPSMQSLIP